MRIAFLSDIHYGNMANPKWENGTRPFYDDDHEALAKRAHDASPDVLVVTGDLAETNSPGGLDLLPEFLDTYKNPYGASLLVPGNHDVWCSNNGMGPEEKYAWHEEQADKHGWVMLRDEPWSMGGNYFVGNMGWYDFSSAPTELGMTPERYERDMAWADYSQMGYSRMHPAPRAPMTEFCKNRMAELKESLGKVPGDRKSLTVVTHVVGFSSMLGPIRDYSTAFFGNLGMGRMISRAGPDLYYCGHTHYRAEATIDGIRCINNGSGYGYDTKILDVIDI